MGKAITKQHRQQFVVIVPAAGVGKRMLASCPKQYLTINNTSILAHTVSRLLSHPKISKIVLVLSEYDQYFAESELANHTNILRVSGGKERVDSVLNGLVTVDEKYNPWVLVHDAARPCVTHQDIDKLISQCLINDCGGLLASPVRDTMKRGGSLMNGINRVQNTVERTQLWHALTPQMYKTSELLSAIMHAQKCNLVITDESSAIEQAGLRSVLIHGSSDNIKVTHPDDLSLAEFYLNKQEIN